MPFAHHPAVLPFARLCEPETGFTSAPIVHSARFTRWNCPVNSRTVHMAYILANDPNLFKDIRFNNDILIIGVGGLKSQSVFIVVDFFQSGVPIVKDSSYIDALIPAHY